MGYTNAGKSTLLNRVTRSEVLAEDQLFATLDTTTRRFRLPEEREIILADTVGFIEDLPDTLIQAFRPRWRSSTRRTSWCTCWMPPIRRSTRTRSAWTGCSRISGSPTVPPCSCGTRRTSRSPRRWRRWSTSTAGWRSRRRRAPGCTGCWRPSTTPCSGRRWRRRCLSPRVPAL
ncbi:MAG: 50S ribosome-binding GTPase [Alphaproteobacteria bacterium]|nr:50S ribosome-binding GTPase [Alphaproteobacteria bacterium]